MTSMKAGHLSDLKVELEQSTRKNRELAETNRQNMKEYTKLKMQYEKVMSKTTIGASYAKANGLGNAAMPQGQSLYDGGVRQVVHAGANGGNSRIGVRLLLPTLINGIANCLPLRQHQVELFSLSPSSLLSVETHPIKHLQMIHYDPSI